MRAWLLAVAIVAGCRSGDEGAKTNGLPQPARRADQPPAPAVVAAPDAAPPGPTAAAPEPPAVPGARLVSRATVHSFSVCRGQVYWCEDNVLRAAPTSGRDAARALGSCMGGSDVACDADSVYTCGDHLVRRTSDEEIALAGECIAPVVDDTHVYYIRPGWDDAPDPGVYRVSKAGGAPEKLYARTQREQYILALDGDGLWIGTFGAGIISKLSTSDGKLTAVVKGQKRMVDLAVDSGTLYWLIEDASEIRRRAVRGGAIEVIGRGVSKEPLVVEQGHAYWFEGGEQEPQRLVHLAPGAAEPDEVVAGLDGPWLAADEDALYLCQSRKPGIFAVAR